MISWWWIVVAVLVTYTLATAQKEWERKETLKAASERFYVDEEALGSTIGNWWRRRKNKGNCGV